jgi:hemolysin III
MKPSLPHLETPAEETASGITHAAGLLGSIAAVSLLIVFASFSGDARCVVSICIYGTTLLLMYFASACYHFVRSPRTKRAMRIFDHATIYLLIAGTYTPVLLISMRGGWGWSMFGIIWGLAVAGIILKLFFVGRFELLSTITYVLMAWLALICLRPLIAAVPSGGVAWLFAGGLAYTSGVAFFLWDYLPFNHAIWHLFVLAGSVCHFLAVWLYVLPRAS